MRPGFETAGGEGSLEIRERVTAVRKVQQERFNEQKIYSNAQMTPKLIRQHCEIDDDSRRHLEHAMTKMGLSARAYDRILKVSRTLADLDRMESIQAISPKRSSTAAWIETTGIVIGRSNRDRSSGEKWLLTG